ncbi:transporter, major facilitator family protein [Veillonella dispar ATCC 17748]|uniref:Transporter, major facilitator family protein n=1 Tax=Veillonella dispar ATCC 17748 TaxID=546273 RepID=C4FMZ8_9FIRM|nr:MFS transporter [Veillonella dispar]EEP66090.1 transporter, major facilitator family protein [Veillonella dispar ATCC 17748]VEG94437.1 Fosmidomycin resistance protein [Veillonella dispar]
MKRIIRKYGPPIFHCINDFGQGSLAALIPFFIANFGLNYYQSASIIFCNTVVASIAQPILGYVADRWRVPWFIPVGFTVTLVSISAIALASSYEMILALSLIAGIGAALFHPEAALLVNRTQSNELGNAMGRFAVGGSAGFALGPLLAGGVYVFGGQFLWLFTAIALIGVLLYVYAFTGSTDTDAIGESKSSAKSTNSGTNDWVSFGKLFFVIASRSILFSVLSIFIPILYITVINGEASASSLALTMYFAMGAVLTYMGGALSDKLGFLKTVRLGNLIFLPSVLVFIFVPNIWGFFGAMIPMAFGVFSQYGPITVLGQKYLAKNAGFASGITLGLGITLGGLVAPYVGHIADIYDVQTALMTLIPVGAIGLLMSFWLKEPK